MKGNLAALAVATVISILAITGVVFYGVVNKAHAVTKGIEERNIVESENQLNRLIEMGMEQAALYSTYQAAYNVSKHGTYQHGAYDTFGKCDVSLIDPALLNKIPKTLPYWRILSTACFGTTGFPSTPAEIEDKVIRPWLEKEISDRFNEYIIAIRNEYDNDIDIPPYTSKIQLSDGETVSFEISTTGEIKYDSEKLKLSHPLKKITKTIGLPLKRLIDLGVDNFIKVPDPFSEKIEEAHQAMGGITVKDMVNANQNSVKPAYVDDDLNNGELTDRTAKNCKSTEYKRCINPDVIPDFTYPPKADLLPTNCEAEFKTKSTSNIDALDKVVGDTDVSIEPKFIETKVDVNDETICSTLNAANSSASCDCMKWACRGSIKSGVPVVVGTNDQTLALPSEIEVTNTPTCAECISINGGTCTQFTGKVCPSGYDPRDADGDGTVEDNECVQVSSKACPADHPNEWDSDGDGEKECYKLDICLDDQKCSPTSGCISDPGNKKHEVCWWDKQLKQCSSGTTPHESECWSNTQKSIECPASTTEFGSTGHCFKSAQLPSCILHKTLYTKICNYNYQANVAVLVNATDKIKKYPVYDSVEGKTDLRNLELQFYVLSKN